MTGARPARGPAAALLAAAGLFAAPPAAADDVGGDTHYHFRVVLSSNTATEGQTGKITVRLQCVATSHAPCGSTHPGDDERNGGNMTITVTNPSGSNNGVTLSTNKVVGWTIAARQSGVSNVFTYGTSNRGTVELTLQDNSTQDGTRQVTVSASFNYTPGVYWWYRAGGRDVRPRIQDATLVIMDDEAPSPELVVNEGSDNATTVTEAGSADSFTVALSTNPTANVSVAVSVDSDDTDECEVSLDGGANYLAAGSSGTLTFVPTGGSTAAARTTQWDTPQTVTVRAVDDTTGGEVDATCDVELDPSSTDADYNGLSTVTVDVTVKDNERTIRAVNTAGDGFTMNEGGTSTFRVEANQAVTEQVTIALSVTPVSPTVAGDVTLSTTSLTIASGATDTGTFVVTAVDDNVDKGQNEYAFTINADATGGNVADYTFPDFRVTDNDDAAVVLSDLAQSMNPRETVTEAGGTATFDVALTTQPTASVTVAVSSSDDGECRVSTAGSATPAASKTLTFTAMNWSTAQTVTLTGQDDDADDGDRDCTITANASSAGDAVYNSSTEVPDVSFTARNTDDDDAALSVTGLAQNTAPHETVTEAGGTATFNVALASEPTASVTVTVSSSDDGECRVSTAGSATPAASKTLTFTAANWSTAQAVTLTGQDDAADDGDVDCTITVAASSAGDALYNSVSDVPDVSFTARNTDNDGPPTVTLSSSASSISESSGTATITATLNRASSAATTITLTGVSGAYAPGSDSTITIAAGTTSNSSDTASITAVPQHPGRAEPAGDGDRHGGQQRGAGRHADGDGGGGDADGRRRGAGGVADAEPRLGRGERRRGAGDGDADRHHLERGDDGDRHRSVWPVHGGGGRGDRDRGGE